VKYSLGQPESVVGATRGRGRHDADRTQQLHPALGTVCPGCGARIGKPCVSMVRTLGVGAVGVPIEGVHAERIAAAREEGVA